MSTLTPMKGHRSEHADSETKERVLKLRLYVVRRKDRYYANCVDLNLSVERPTMEQAVREIHSQIESYFADISILGFPKHLLYRRSRLSKRLEYYKLRLLCGLINRLAHKEDCEVEVRRKQIPCAA